MDAEEAILARRDAVVATHGEWTASNIHLGGSAFTRSPDDTTDMEKLRRVTQLVVSRHGRDLTGVRVLDLGCLEGLYSIELAHRGATVVGIEGRDDHVARARFAVDELGLGRVVAIEHGDVRDLDPSRQGRFDLVLCLGLLYHLEAGDALDLLATIAELCVGTLVIDTHVCRRDQVNRSLERGGIEYLSMRVDETVSHPHASIGNVVSDYFTRESLVNALVSVGFPTVADVIAPVEIGKPRDRVTLAAFRDDPVELLTMPHATTDWSPALEDDDPKPATYSVPRTTRRAAARLRAGWRVVAAFTRRGRRSNRTGP